MFLRHPQAGGAGAGKPSSSSSLQFYIFSVSMGGAAPAERQGTLIDEDDLGRNFDLGPAVGKNERRSDGMDFGELLGVSAGSPCVDVCRSVCGRCATISNLVFVIIKTLRQNLTTGAVASDKVFFVLVGAGGRPPVSRAQFGRNFFSSTKKWNILSSSSGIPRVAEQETHRRLPRGRILSSRYHLRACWDTSHSSRTLPRRWPPFLPWRDRRRTARWTAGNASSSAEQESVKMILGGILIWIPQSGKMNVARMAWILENC